MATVRPILVYYEHPDWFRPLFAEFERREIAHRLVDASRHRFDPALDLAPRPTNGAANGGSRSATVSVIRGRVSIDPAPFANGDGAGAAAPLVFNRMSPSAWKRGRADAILYTLHYLRYLRSAGVPVFNGLRAFTVETSKALQLSILRRLGLRAPRTQVVNHPSALPAAARALEFPLVVKPNIGGSGAGIVRFDRLEDLEAAVEGGRVSTSVDGILLLQEFHPPIGDSIVRVETLEGRYLYGIRVHIGEGAGFDLCPADICKDTQGVTLESAACPVGAAKAGLTVERFDPPAEIRAEVERIARASGIDVGGIEYLESRRDGWRYYYDVNALSNFVADPVRVVGFDPTERLVDALVRRASSDAPPSRRRRTRREGRARGIAPAPITTRNGGSTIEPAVHDAVAAPAPGRSAS